MTKGTPGIVSTTGVTFYGVLSSALCSYCCSLSLECLSLQFSLWDSYSSFNTQEEEYHYILLWEVFSESHKRVCCPLLGAPAACFNHSFVGLPLPTRWSSQRAETLSERSLDPAAGSNLEPENRVGT